MSPRVVWLVAIVIQMTGILLIGDDVITARRKARQRGDAVVADGTRRATDAPPPTEYRPIKSVLGIGLLATGFLLVFLAG